jgi:hypothetical protein
MSVTAETIAIALGRTAPAADSLEYEQWEMWISDALLLITARLGDPALLDQNKVDYVVREAVVSHIKHPDDATQVSVSVDNGSVAKTYRTARGRITILDEWWELLSPKASSGAFSIIPGKSCSAHLPWCDLMFGGTTCSCGVSIAGYPIYEVEGY